MSVEAKARCEDCNAVLNGLIEINKEGETFFARGNLCDICSDHHNELRPTTDPDALQHNFFLIEGAEIYGRMMVTGQCSINRFETIKK